jgi:DNA-binding CsgD family transcriptional regulator
MASQRFRAVIAMPFDPDEAWGAKADHPVSGTMPRLLPCGPRSLRPCGMRVPLMWAWTRRRCEPLHKARQALGAVQARAAEDRGAEMGRATAIEYALMLTSSASPPRTPGPGPGQLSPREQQLITLVAQGHTDAQIAAQLYISIRTVRSHLDRIRDKTGCRRRAALTRLALSEGLV